MLKQSRENTVNYFMSVSINTQTSIVSHRRIGLTGANGFIGGHLLKALQGISTHRVKVFKRKNKRGVPARSEFLSFVKDSDIIYHLGGVNRGTPTEVLRGNILTMQNLIQAVQSLKGDWPHVIFTSSSQVYQLKSDNATLRESDPVEPQSIYGIAKKTAEELLTLSKIPHTLLRFSNVYGPACRPHYNSVVATLCDQALQGKTLTLNGDGEKGRDFLFINDAIHALIAVGISSLKETRGLYNVSSGKITTLNQIAQQIRQQISETCIQHRLSAPSGDPSYRCDSHRFRRRFKWKPETSIQEGIPLTLQWYKKRLSQ
ncbi:MAG: hypothetical protein COV66_02810 [Nitrospinae bacterium CG11_big_fil_rev_8_21_14_0_20_45_15]|nr:MAG: hypothetical protein COV66_02810 [Nitrospinae bacterium CG11_big_fil_rev_8_21_14_0_20_45_15]